MMTITIAAITIGIAVDNSIHYIYRFKEEFSKIKVGNRVKTDIIASNIAIPVKIPNKMVGINFEKTRIENPKTIVIDVFRIAIPTDE